MALLSVSFGTGSGEETLMLAEDYERGGNKSLYAAGEKSYVRVYPAGADVEVTVSGGTWKYAARGISETHREYIPFADQSAGKLKYPVVRVISVSRAADGTAPFVGGRSVRFRESRLDCVSVEYETLYDLIEVTGLSAGYVIVKAVSAAGTDYLELDYTGDETDLSSRMVILTARDAASREIIPYAQVFLNGTFRGVTDGGGMLNLGRLKKGLYSLFVRRDGYLDTDKDNLKNDSFRVE
ncbi:hypothetical protein EP073_12000 [Geovibrio thiophilus]|uniref:PEGA domain-containing protein n=1 Tax=Geovibrio thiophilus TaxID=139438 RepID=A0A3R6AZH0_9BACT|nr:hypothetical protein [Geovibrio thiophilus]QAR34099.1 hypothetical protein EP073_12000 [Geovibrio thiophilus]